MLVEEEEVSLKKKQQKKVGYVQVYFWHKTKVVKDT